MAESTPPSRAPLDEEDRSEPEPSRSTGRRPLRLIDAPVRLPAPSHPPSEPRPIPGRPGADAGPDRPARVQLIAALLLLLVLVVVPLYLWRRPRAATQDETKSVPSAVASAVVAPPPSAEPAPRSRNGVTLGDAKVLGCHDPGPRRTPPDQCDHLPDFEAAFAKAILDSSSCVPAGTPAGAIAFLADASYGRRRNPIRLRHRRDDTTLSSKVAAACVREVHKALAASSMDRTHGHSRYEIEIDATYAAKP